MKAYLTNLHPWLRGIFDIPTFWFFGIVYYPFEFHNKNLAKKLSDFDEILASKSTQMVFWVVTFSSKSDNFLAKFLNYLKKG